MKTTTELLRSIAYASGPACHALAADAREIATRRGVTPDVADRFAVLTAKLDFAERLPTEAELAELAALGREIDVQA